MILCAAAPPVGSAAAIAAMLRMNTAVALLGSVAISLLSPLYLPALVQSLGAASLVVDTLRMMLRIACIVLGAAAVSTCCGALLALGSCVIPVRSPAPPCSVSSSSGSVL